MSYKMQNRGRQHSRLGQSPVTGQLRCYSSGYLPRLVPIAPSFSLDPVHGRKAAELSACRLPMHALPALLGEMLSALQPTAYLGQYVPRYLRYVARFRHLLRKTSMWRQEQPKVQS